MTQGIKVDFEQIVVMSYGIITSFEQVVVMSHDWDALYGNTFDDLPEDVDLSKPTFFSSYYISWHGDGNTLCHWGNCTLLPHIRSLRFENERQSHCMLLQNQRPPWEHFGLDA